MTSFHFLIKVYLDGAHSLLKLNSGFIPGSKCFTSTPAVNIEAKRSFTELFVRRIMKLSVSPLVPSVEERSSDSSDDEREEEKIRHRDADKATL